MVVVMMILLMMMMMAGLVIVVPLFHLFLLLVLLVSRAPLLLLSNQRRPRTSQLEQRVMVMAVGCRRLFFPSGQRLAVPLEGQTLLHMGKVWVRIGNAISIRAQDAESVMERLTSPPSSRCHHVTAPAREMRVAWSRRMPASPLARPNTALRGHSRELGKDGKGVSPSSAGLRHNHPKQGE